MAANDAQPLAAAPALAMAAGSPVMAASAVEEVTEEKPKRRSRKKSGNA